MRLNKRLQTLRLRVYCTLLCLYLILASIGILYPHLLDNSDGYADEQLQQFVPWSIGGFDVLRHTPFEKGELTARLVHQIQRHFKSGLPVLHSVADNRTKATVDFYEVLGMLRLVGPSARAEEQRVASEIDMEAIDGSAHNEWPNDVHFSGYDFAIRAPLQPYVTYVHCANASRRDMGQTMSIDAEEVAMVRALVDESSWRRFDLPRRRAARHPRFAWRKFFIALNLYDNEEVLPFLTGSLVAFIEDELAPFFDVGASVVVSIYANAGHDMTGPLIRSFLIPQLHNAGVRTVFAATNGTCMGYAERQKFHERIEWMACVRNKAIEPLYELGMNVFHIDPAEGEVLATDSPESDEAEEMVVLFLNDIFVRPNDIITLLESVVEPTARRRSVPDGFVTPATVTEATDAAAQDKGTSFDMACGMDFFTFFYDTWVSRDRHGGPFFPWAPYSDDVVSQEAFYNSLNAAREQGAEQRYSLPVKCCWNGIAAIRGTLFLEPPPTRRINFPHASSSVSSAADKQMPLYEVADVGVAAVTDGATARADAASAPPVVRRRSGQVYDRLDKNAAERVLQAYYYRVLLRRAVQLYDDWDDLHKMLERKARRTLYPRLGHYPRNLSAMLRELAGGPTEAYLLQSARFDRVLLAGARDNETGVVDEDASAFWTTQGVANDGEFYRARYPALRFRHSLVPSYGAQVYGEGGVVDEVCLSSECLLICEDIAQAVVLQSARAPVIVMNPNVRVAYRADVFDSLSTRHLLVSPVAFRLAVRLRHLKLWIDQVTRVIVRLVRRPMPWATARVNGMSGCDGFDVISTDSLGSCGERHVDVTNDWSDAALRRPVMPLLFLDASGVGRWGMFNLTRLSTMACFHPGDGTMAFLKPLLPVSRVVTLIICAVFMRWLYTSCCRDGLRQRHMLRKLALNRTPNIMTTQCSCQVRDTTSSVTLRKGKR